MRTSLSTGDMAPMAARLEAANRAFSERYPGDGPGRQPVHTVYGGAQLFKADAAPKLGKMALASLTEHAPDFVTFAHAVGLPGHERLPTDAREVHALCKRMETDAGWAQAGLFPAWLSHTIYSRVVAKLTREPVEDFRIDFEDGYGHRADAEEDGHAEAAALQVAKAMSQGTLPPFIGIRIKPFTEELRARGMRTLDIFLTTLVGAAGKLPEGFLITLPKVQIPEQAAALADLFDLLEPKLQLPRGSLRCEIMVEVTPAVINARGQAPLPLMIEALRGRCTAAHFGTYDYTASCNITAAHQHMAHAACDFAKHVMQVTLSGTGLFYSDGATNIMPVGLHRAEPGKALSTQELLENRAAVHAAWKLHAEHVRKSLVQGFYQGWDLHPAQLPTRYAAVYAFFLESLPAASERLKNFVAKASQATLVGDVFDDAATGQGLLNFFLRGLSCGALTEAEVLATGLTVAEIRTRSFAKIMKARRGH